MPPESPHWCGLVAPSAVRAQVEPHSSEHGRRTSSFGHRVCQRFAFLRALFLRHLATVLGAHGAPYAELAVASGHFHASRGCGSRVDGFAEESNRPIRHQAQDAARMPTRGREDPKQRGRGEAGRSVGREDGREAAVHGSPIGPLPSLLVVEG